ncbi:MAG: hypothetical protein AAF697_03030 [Pseudomonadota bacterium]
MANSSDWIEALSRIPEPGGGESASDPVWMEALRLPSLFREGAPFSAPKPSRDHAPDMADEPVGNAELEQSDRASVAAEPTSTEPSPPDPMISDPLDSDPIADAFARGHAAGHADALSEHADADQEMRAMRLTFRAFDQAANDAFARELADTVVALCGSALEGFATNPVQLLARCEEAATRLGSAAGECRLHLNPHDLAALDRASLGQWDVVADETVPRAGLRFEGPDGSVSDGPDNWRRAIASAIQG